MRLRAAVVLAVLAMGCRHRPAAPPPVVEEPAPVVVSPWPGVLSAAQRAAAASEWTVADSILVEFMREHPDAPENDDAAYLRAILGVERAAADSTAARALAAIDGYLFGGESRQRFVEARALRRLLVTTDSLRAAAAAARTAGEAREKAKDEELLKLKDEHDKALAELERIKRRLSGRPPQQ